MLQEKFKEGLFCFQKATDMNELDVGAFHDMGHTYYRLDMMEDAISAFSKAMDINPRRTDRSVSFASVLLKENRRDEAEKILTQAVEVSNDDLDLKEDIIDLCFEHEFNALAAKACKDILDRDPDRTYLKDKHGEALRLSGQTPEEGHVLDDSVEAFLKSQAALNLSEENKDSSEGPSSEKTVDEFSNDIDLLLTLAHSYLDLQEFDKAKEMAEQAISVEPDNEEARDIIFQCTQENDEQT